MEGALLSLLKTCLQMIAFFTVGLLVLALFITVLLFFSERKSPNPRINVEGLVI
jgi:hypothetical protein